MPASKRALFATFSAIAIVAMTLLAGPASAQVLYGSLTGNVTDASGAAVPSVKVEALNTDTGTAKQGLTDERGTYLFSDLQPGTYKVTISAPAFATRVFEGAAITLNTVLRLDVSLSVSQVVESLVVNAGAVALQTDRADINNQIRSSQITDLPLINSQGRNFQILYKILPDSPLRWRPTPTRAIRNGRWSRKPMACRSPAIIRSSTARPSATHGCLAWSPICLR